VANEKSSYIQPEDQDIENDDDSEYDGSDSENDDSCDSIPEKSLAIDQKDNKKL